MVGVFQQLRLLVTVCIFMADLLQEISQGVIIRKCSFQSASFLGSEKRECRIRTQNVLVSEKSKILGKSGGVCRVHTSEHMHTGETGLGKK